VFRDVQQEEQFGDKWSEMVYMFRYSGMTSVPAYASLCNDCGKCEEFCPQHLEISALLRDVAKEFDSFLHG
jgi:hypothetical protein